MALGTITPRTSITELAEKINSEIERLEGELSSLKSTAEYLLKGGEEGGRTIYGGTKAREDLQLESTSGSPKGEIILKDKTQIADTLYVDKENGRIGISQSSPSWAIHVSKSSGNIGKLLHGTGTNQIILIRLQNNHGVWDIRQTGGTHRFDIVDVTNNKFPFRITGNSETESLVINTNGLIQFKALPTEDLEIVDAGSTGATEQDWIEVEVGGVVGYIRVFASK